MAETVTWPDGARCAVMMTFDLDGESPWIHRDPALAERPLHMSMGAYGPKTGMPRILELLDRYGIKTCIFIPGWIVERYPALCEEIVQRGHEVGHHGYLHEKPFFLKSREEEEALLVKSLDIFKKILGVGPLGSRVALRRSEPAHHGAPRASTASSITATRSTPTCPTATRPRTAPWWSSPPRGATTTRRSSSSARCRRWATASGASRTCGRSGPRSSRASTRRAASSTGSGHPQVIGRPSRMRMVERLIQLILGKGDVWWPRPIDLARFWLEQQQAAGGLRADGGRAARRQGRARHRRGPRLRPRHRASPSRARARGSPRTTSGSRAGADAVVAEAERLGAEAVALRGDVAREDDVQALVAAHSRRASAASTSSSTTRASWCAGRCSRSPRRTAGACSTST